MSDQRPLYSALRWESRPLKVGVTLLVIIVGVLLSWWLVRRADQTMREELLLQTRLVTRTINYDRIQSLSGTEADVEKPEYLRLKSQLAAVTQADDNWRFVYLMGRKDDGRLFFFVDSDPVGAATEAPAGMLYEDAPPGFLQAMDTGVALVEGPFTDRWGAFVSGCAPVRDRAGNIIALLAMDFDAAAWKRNLVLAAMPAAWFTVAMLVILFIGGALLTHRNRLAEYAPRWMHYLESAIALAAGVTLTLFVASLMNQNEQRLRRDTFAQLAASRTLAIADTFNDLRNIELEGLARFFEGSEQVSPTEFHHFTAYLQQNTSVQAWVWIPVVPAAEKPRFEEDARAAGVTGFEIWEADEAGGRRPAVGREVYYPIVYTTNLASSDHVLGYDLGSEPVRRAAIEEAARTGLVTGTDPIVLLSDRTRRRGMLILRPVAGNSGQGQLRGYVFAVLHIQKLLESVGSSIATTHLEIALLEPQGGREPLATTCGVNEPLETSISMTRPVFAFGKAFAITAHADAEFLRLHPLRAWRLAVLVGSALTVMLAMILGMMLRRRSLLEHLVVERTRELQESEARYRLIMENTIDRIWQTDMNLAFTYSNTPNTPEPRFLPDDILGRSIGDYLSPDDFERVQALFHRELGKGPDQQGVRFETAALSKSGEMIYIEVRARILYDEHGNATGVQGITHDINDRRRMEQQLEKETRFNRLLLDASPALIVAISAYDKTLMMNRAMLKLLEYSEEEVLGTDYLSAFVPEEEREQVSSVFTNLIVNQAPTVNENHIISKSGKQFLIEWHGQTVQTNTDDAPFFIGVGIDITARKQAEEQLRLSAHQWQTTFNAIGDALWMLDSDFRIVQCNTAAEALLKRPAGEIIGQDCWRVFHGTASPPASCLAERITKSLKRETMEDRIGDGWYAASADPVLDEKGTLVGVVHVVADITERKQREEEREKLKEQLSQAQKMESVGRLAGGVAHDYNNMLGVIIGYTQLALDRTSPDQPLYEDLMEIRKAAEHSVEITRQLLAFARKQEAIPKVLDLNATVEGMIKILRRLIGENIDLAWQPGTNISQVKMDPSQLDQILANLCVNARDAISDVGKITIETDTVLLDEDYCAAQAGLVPGEYVLLAVSDNGKGMDAETLANIFEPFFTTKEVGKGTGLGLATVYGIVKQNGGFVNVYSEPAQGSTFKIYLPPHLENARHSPERDEPATISAESGETILLVEDEPGLLRMTAKMLERQGYQVLPAAAPAEAIRLADTHADGIHLLMTDVVMPGMNGRELAQMLMAAYPNLKCLYTSGYTANVIAHHGVLDPDCHFIQKPFSMKELAAKVREVFNSE